MPQVPPIGGLPAGYSCTDLEADARYRIGSGCGLHVNKKLPVGMSPEYARLILIRAAGLFHEMSRLDPRCFIRRFTYQEKALLTAVIDLDSVLQFPPLPSKAKTK
jgi:hypothetical protein